MEHTQNVAADRRRAVVECRDLLRDFRKPDRLIDNSLVAPAFRSARTPSDRTELLESIISKALSLLESRERAIIQRCDVNGERFKNVASSLGISERHLYRERRRILGRLAEIVRSCSQEPARIQISALDEIAARLRTSRILEENGSDRAAAAIFENLLSELADPAIKCQLLLRLSEFHSRAGRFGKARETLNEATHLAQGSNFAEGTLEGEIHLTRAYIFEQCGQGELVVAQAATDAARFLLRDGTFRYEDKSAGTLMGALLLCGQSYISSGQLRELSSVTSQAMDVYALLRRPDEDAQIAILFLASLRSLFCAGDLRAAILSLSDAVNVARRAGFTLSSVVQLANLASLYSLQKEPNVAIHHLQSVLPMVRELGNSHVLLIVLVELAQTYLDMGRYEEAQMLLIEAAKQRTEDEAMRAAMICTSAEVNIATQDFSRGLEDARAAESLFAALGKTRVVGTAQRLQAQAHLGLGEWRAARRSISNAIEALSSRNSKVMLERAYEVLDQIEDNGRRFASKTVKQT